MPDNINDLASQFPPDFAWGVATSAFQIEGAAFEDGKGESIWDRFCRQPGAIADGSNGDVACDHYHRLDADLDLIAGLGVDLYRFSISWPRVQPEGEGAWNEKGLAFYDRLVDGLLERGLAPHLTLNHWDLPQALQDKGGWAARDTVHRFVDYALGIQRRLGDRAAAITTHNEPWVVAWLGHAEGTFAPGVKSRKVAHQVAHHLLLSHGLALRALRAEGARARLGIVLNMAHTMPLTGSPEDAAQAVGVDLPAHVGLGTGLVLGADRAASTTPAAAAGTPTRCSRAPTRRRYGTSSATTPRRCSPATWPPSRPRWTSSASTTTRATSPARRARSAPSTSPVPRPTWAGRSTPTACASCC